MPAVENIGGLDRQDLFLLMEAYRNNFESLTTLFEQQKGLNESYNKLLKEQENITTALNKMVDKIDKYTDELQAHHSNINNSLSSIKSKVHITWIGIGAVVIPLIALVTEMIRNLHVLHSVSNYLAKLVG